MASTHSEAAVQPLGEAMRPRGVDGVAFAEWAAPASAEELSSILRDAAVQGRAVTPYGGGTKLSLGNVPNRVDLALSTERLNGVLHYEPTDMTLSVEAGARFADVQAHLGERGQTLPLDVADTDRATIGGLIATALAGPRRYGSGTLRDLLIGISVAYPDGTIGKAGGLVVKNVTGFDLMRLHLGALGTLGVILSANFKVMPLARSEATLLTEPMDLAEAARHAVAARGGRLRPIALELFSHEGGWRCAARFEGRPQTVELGIEAVGKASTWSATRVDEESGRWWRDYVSGQSLRPDNAIIVRCAVAPKQAVALLAAVEDTLARQAIIGAKIACSPGLGTVLVGFGSDGLESDALARLQAEFQAIAETVTVLSAPAALKRGIDVWGRPPATVSVMRALKLEFDPAGILNPGRFVDRI